MKIKNMPKRKFINEKEMQEEIKLLKSGLTYDEVSIMTERSKDSIYGRNKKFYQINLIENFRLNLDNKIININHIKDDFGYWFSGLFDGEGHVLARCENRTGTENQFNLKIGIQIKLRYDDIGILKRIQNNLSIGNINKSKSHKTTKMSYSFNIKNSKDMYESIIPIFKKYPLYSKKKLEIEQIEEVTKEMYINTMGGKTKFRNNTECAKLMQKAQSNIYKIRKA